MRLGQTIWYILTALILLFVIVYIISLIYVFIKNKKMIKSKEDFLEKAKNLSTENTIYDVYDIFGTSYDYKNSGDIYTYLEYYYDEFTKVRIIINNETDKVDKFIIIE